MTAIENKRVIAFILIAVVILFILIVNNPETLKASVIFLIFAVFSYLIYSRGRIF